MLETLHLDLNNFRFQHRESAFLDTFVWKLYGLEQKEVADQTRLMMADLAMNAALSIRYNVEASMFNPGVAKYDTTSIKENISMGVGQRTLGIFHATITSNSVQKTPPRGEPVPVKQLLTTFQQFIAEHKGERYTDTYPETYMGTNDASGLDYVEIEFIANRLKSYLIYMEGLAEGHATIWENQLFIELQIPGISNFKVQLILAKPNFQQ